MTTHTLKTLPEYFDAVRSGDKRCEVRKNDRSFAVGDKLCLREWDQQLEAYTRRMLWMRVTHILHGGQFGLARGYVCMSIKPAGEA